MMTLTSTSATIDRILLEPVAQAMSLEFAKNILEIRADPETQARIDELAEKCNEGLLNAEEMAEYENLIQLIHTMGILHRAAKRVVARALHSDGHSDT
jgi:hypothetical protein